MDIHEQHTVTLGKENTLFDKHADPSYFPIIDTGIKLRPSVVKIKKKFYVVEGSGLAFKRFQEMGFCTANDTTEEFDDDFDEDDFIPFDELRETINA